MYQPNEQTTASRLWLVVVLAVLCGPSDFFGLLWLLYHVYDTEVKVSYSRSYAILLFFFYLVVSGFGVYLLCAALIFLAVSLVWPTRVRTRVIATILMALAVIGTLKASWVMGFRH
jgi:hypothetical protein